MSARGGNTGVARQALAHRHRYQTVCNGGDDWHGGEGRPLTPPAPSPCSVPLARLGGGGEGGPSAFFLCWGALACLALASPVNAQATVAPPKSHAAAVKALDAFIAQQVKDKRLPALSIALVDDQKVLWAKGYGHADLKGQTPATAETVYRVGSVSKLFTDLAVMQLVEKGDIDLDAPVTKYLPDFKPKVPFDKAKAITLRQLMSHRSGLIREPPVGNYFDDEDDSLARMVASLNGVPLVYRPEAKTKYSNAGIAVVGYVLEKTQKQAFAKYLQSALLGPLGMKSSSFEPTAAVKKRLAEAIMWTYHGRQFKAPTFELGMAPAGSMYSSVLDLARFQRTLFAKGSLDGKAIVKPATLEAMWRPQFVKETKEGFGLGFNVSQWKGRRRVGHGGAMYGFATDLSALPDDKLGVAVVCSCDCANAVMTRIADVALEHLLAVKDKKRLPKIETTAPLTAAEVSRLAGRYEGKDRAFDLAASAGRLYLVPARGGFRFEVRKQGDAYVSDDRLVQGAKVEPVEGGLLFGLNTYKKVKAAKPADVPGKWRGLIGEYGWDHNVLYILEKDGKLHALIEWFFLYPLEEESKDVYLFPKDHGLYHGEKLVFTRDKAGKATKVEAASVVFKRRRLDGEDGKTFKIKPLRPVAELRKEALKAKPPEERGELRKSDLVELVKLDKTIKLDVRYATKDNFLNTPFYRSAKAFLQRPAAEALVRVHKALAKQGYGLMVHDGYRPWSVTKMFWDATPENLRIFVANPAHGSRHNRGCAVDLTLYDLKTGKPVEMVGGYDEMSDRSYPDYLGGTSLQRWHRDLLRRAMEADGFTVYEAEWWHFDHKDWRKYAIGNKTFEELANKR
jgi:CubicO group peptidase (beta-lactamase class C family)/D-alanyl-D-alanine dipeptidase